MCENSINFVFISFNWFFLVISLIHDESLAKSANREKNLSINHLVEQEVNSVHSWFYTNAKIVLGIFFLLLFLLIPFESSNLCNRSTGFVLAHVCSVHVERIAFMFAYRTIEL